MQAKIIPIGTSKGVRIPKYLLDKYHFDNLVDIDDTGSGLLIRAVSKSRDGWKEAFKKLAQTKDDLLIETPSPEWDEDEWEW